MANIQDLKTIMRSDPDGGEREPTDADHAAHKSWAIATFGEATWIAYQTPGWGEADGPGGGYYLDESEAGY